ncbi:MAG: hypothetical protein HY560_09150 [Gemmatimonadetes bacterium]|nr:hypothetical protein [Gemmatimonadota bacterium]
MSQSPPPATPASTNTPAPMRSSLRVLPSSRAIAVVLIRCHSDRRRGASLVAAAAEGF